MFVWIWEIWLPYWSFVVVKLHENWVTYLLYYVVWYLFLLWSSLVFNSAINMLSCRLTRTFYRKWLRWDSTGTNWLNLFGTGYKIRFRPFQTIFSLQIFKLYVLFLVSFFRLLLLTICYWTTGFVLLAAILELSSKRLWCVYSLISYFVLLNF